MGDDGLFIVIEGLDASGKATQTQLLVDRLEGAGETVRKVEFPAYDTPFGRLVRKYLDGEYGDKQDIPVEVRALLYSADRYQFKDDFSSFLDDGGVLVADRYSQSNYAFQSAATDDDDALVDWMQQVDARLPQPDIVFFLDVPPSQTAQLMANRDQDQHEADTAFQRQVYERYTALAEQEGWTIIDCMENSELRAKHDIADEIWRRVEELR